MSAALALFPSSRASDHVDARFREILSSMVHNGPCFVCHETPRGEGEKALIFWFDMEKAADGLRSLNAETGAAKFRRIRAELLKSNPHIITRWWNR